MIPITDEIIAKKSISELEKMKKINIGGCVVTSLLTLVLFYFFIEDTSDFSSLTIALCTSYLPVLYISNLSKINKSIKTK